MPLLRIEADVAHRVADDRLALAAVGHAVDLEALADDVLDGHARIEAAEGILEDDLHLPPEEPQRLGRQDVDTLAVEEYPALARDQPEQGLADRRLARARLAGYAQGLAPPKLEVDAVHRLHVAARPPKHAALDREPDLELPRLEEEGPRRVGRRGIRTWARRRGGSSYRDARAARRSRRVPFVSTMRPSCMTATRGRDPAHDLEVVRDEEDGHAELALEAP